MYPEYILEKLRQAWSLDADDTSMDTIFNQWHPDHVFDTICKEGPQLRQWIEDIYGMRLS